MADKKTALPADVASLSFEDALRELESIVQSGTKLDINYHLNDVFEPETLEEIMDYFRDAESDDIEAARVEFDSDYSEEELRMVRLKFMSEVAN
jgi:ATP-dependent DNA helicase RecQ